MNRLMIAFLSLTPFLSMLGRTDPVWRTLSTAPFMSSSRIDDVTFVSDEVGWLANGRGQIWKTTNGGGNWVKVFDKNTIYFRTITFSDSLHGYAFNLGTEEFGDATDTNIVYQTSNGGVTWAANNNFFPQKPRGLCGSQTFGDSMIYAVGRVRGPAFFVRSTDAGQSWQTRDMSWFAHGLLDVFFWSPDSGIAVGHTGTVNETSMGVVLFTANRGDNWTILHTTSQLGEWCWKIDFPTRQVGYISMQRNSGAPVNFLKTTDGGFTWQDRQFSDSAYYVQGIGFASETRGWIGGNNNKPTYVTTDGGDTWAPQPFGVRVNRFWMINDSLGYAVGQTAYKYSRTMATDVVERRSQPKDFALLELYPNPFNSRTTIRYTVTGGSEDPAMPLHISIKLVDLLGREISQLVNEFHRAGAYSTIYDARGLASGIYFVRMQVSSGIDGSPVLSGKYLDIKKLVLLK